MKKIVKTGSVIFSLLLFVQSNLFAQNDNDDDNNKDGKKKYEFVKTKSVNRSYTVSASEKLKIKNSFGKVEVHTWNRNEIKVDVSIETSSNKEEMAQTLLDIISVTDSRSGGVISFETRMKESNARNTKNDRTSMEINYSISMPEGNPLTVDNEFGPTSIPDFRGEVDLTSKFGSLTTGNLANIKGIHVEFGKANLTNISSAPITIKFSKATISKMSGAVKLNLEFCNNVRLSMDNSLTSLDLKTSYSTVNLKPVGELPAAYNIFTSFGSFKNNTTVKFSSDEDEDKQGPKFDYEYSGRNGGGNIPVKVKNSFGKIVLGEASEEDMKDKNKQKSRSRTS